MAHDITQKADIAIADLQANGGLLNPTQSNFFIKKIQEQPTIINDVRNLVMPAPRYEINKIGIGERALHALRSSVGQRALTEDERTKATTERIELNTKEFGAQVDLPYEVLEDNIEGSNIQATILALLAERVSLDLEELLISGNPTAIIPGSSPAVADEFLRQEQGLLYRIQSHTVNANNQALDINIFSNMIKALPNKYRQLQRLKFYVSPNREQDYRVRLSNRQTIGGDALLTGSTPLPVLGVEMRKAALLPDESILLVDPKNIIYGIQRDITLKSRDVIEERVYRFVLSMRVCFGMENEEASVKGYNIG